MAVNISTFPPLALKYHIEGVNDEAIKINALILNETMNELSRMRESSECSENSLNNPF